MFILKGGTTHMKMRTREEIKSLSLDEKLAFFKICGTAFIVDAMNLLRLRRWWMHGIRPMKDGQKLVAPAYTVRLERNRQDEPMYTAYDVVEDCPVGHALVVANIKDSFLVGGNVITLADIRGIPGMVLEGCNRDIADIRALKIAMYSQGVGAVVLPTDIKSSYTPAPCVEIGDGKIYKGDIIVGDDDGVIAVPQEHLDEIIYQAEMIADMEADGAEALKKNLYTPREFYQKIITRKKSPRP